VLASAAALGRTFTASETWLVFAGMGAVAVTPFAFWIRWLVRRVWNHSVRALRLSHALYRVVGVGIAGYGAGALIAQTFAALGGTADTLLLRAFPLLSSVLAAACAWLLMWRDQASGERRGRATAE